MKKYISLDIETIPLSITHEDVKTYLMDKKISKQRRSLDPNYSKIIVICAKLMNQEIKIFEGENEKKMLEDFWNFLNLNRDAVIITHNGYGFDIPFLILRSCINNVKIPVNININKWSMERSNHFDTMIFFSQYGSFINPNLEVLGRLHGVEVEKSEIYGADVERLYKEGKRDLIINKCKQDVELLENVFRKLCLNYLEKTI